MNKRVVLQDVVGSDASGVDLEDVLFENEDLTPEREQVGLDRATSRTKVIETTRAAVDRERREEEGATLEQLLETRLVDIELVRWIQEFVLNTRGWLRDMTMMMVSRYRSRRY